MCINDISRIVIDDSRGMLQIVASLAHDYRGIIYDHNMFIIQANVFIPRSTGTPERRYLYPDRGDILGHWLC
jgi:hypothetical protein